MSQEPPTAASADEDLPLVLRARSGDPEAFDALVMKHQPAIAAMLHHFSANNADLEDLVQETFVKAWSALDRWEPRSPFLHWLKRIAARTGLEYCRKRRTSPLARSVSDLPEVIAAPVVGADRASLEAREILAHLPPDDRALLTLLHLQGFSIAEAADHFGWSRPNTKIKAFRARHRLRKLLNRHGYSFD